MKEIKAYIKPNMLANVVMSLKDFPGLTGLTVSKVQGFGRIMVDARHRMVDDLVDYVPHVKIEIVCKDNLVDQIVAIIEKTAHTGLSGDGIIFVFNVEAATRISTGERGESAL